jgi:uncharacterized protein DUF2846
MNYVKFAALAFGIALAGAPAMAKDNPKAGAAVVLPKPKPGMGQVVLFRPGGMGGAVKCTVREDGKMVGRVSGNRFYVIDAPAGTHTYTTKTESTDTVNVQVEPDETTFVKCKISMGIMVGRPNLSPSTEEEWLKSAPKMKPMEAEKIAAEISKDDSERAAKGSAN